MLLARFKTVPMTLSEYLARPKAPTLTALAKLMNVTPGRLSQLRHSKEWPAEIALEAEKHTGGKLDAATLSPIIKRARMVKAA